MISVPGARGHSRRASGPRGLPVDVRVAERLDGLGPGESSVTTCYARGARRRRRSTDRIPFAMRSRPPGVVGTFDPQALRAARGPAGGRRSPPRQSAQGRDSPTCGVRTCLTTAAYQYTVSGNLGTRVDIGEARRLRGENEHLRRNRVRSSLARGPQYRDQPVEQSPASSSRARQLHEEYVGLTKPFARWHSELTVVGRLSGSVRHRLAPP